MIRITKEFGVFLETIFDHCVLKISRPKVVTKKQKSQSSVLHDVKIATTTKNGQIPAI
jgi:hypothetical protein